MAFMSPVPRRPRTRSERALMQPAVEQQALPGDVPRVSAA
jgi:hypothetical protein